MDAKKYENDKINKSKYNELNALISKHFKSEINNKQKIEKILGEISNINKYLKNSENNANSPKTKRYNINSPSFGCTRPKSVDEIIPNTSQSTNKNKNKNKNIIRIFCYKKPKNYIHNKSMDSVKYKNNKKENYRYNNNNGNDINYNSNYNTYHNSKLISPIYSSKDDKFLQRKKTSENTILSNIDSNENMIKEDTQISEKENSFENIFTKIQTNISRIKQKNTDSPGQSSECSLLKNNNNNFNNYYPVIYPNKNNFNSYNDSNPNSYNNTFYNDKNFKNLSINLANDSNNNTNNVKKKNICQKIYCKTPILTNRVKRYKKNRRKISDDYFMDKNNTGFDLISTRSKNKKDDYYSNDTTCAGTNTNTINYNTNKIITYNIESKRIPKPKTIQCTDYLKVYNHQKQIEKNDCFNYNKNYSSIKMNNNYDYKIFKYKKLSDYILKNNNNSDNDDDNDRKTTTKSYDNSIFKQKIKLIKRKRPKRRKRNKTYDDNIVIDKPSATPVKKEDDKGGKVDLCDKDYNTINNGKLYNKLKKKYIVFTEELNHEININIRNIKINLKKIICIQRWWRNELQKKIIKFNDKYNKYKIKQANNKKKVNSSNKGNEIKIFKKKRFLDKNKSAEIKSVNDKDIHLCNENEGIFRKNVGKICFSTKIVYGNEKSKLLFLQKYIKNQLLKNRINYIIHHNVIKRICYIDKLKMNQSKMIKIFDKNKLNENSVNAIYIGKNENKYKSSNFIYHKQNKNNILENNNNPDNNEIIYNIPLIKNCFISKIYSMKKNNKKTNDNLQIIKEANNEYINIKIPIEKPNYEINNIFSEEITPVPKKTKSLKMQKIETQFLNRINCDKLHTIKIPEIIICKISKIYCIKNRNRLLYKYPLIEKNEYITKITKDKNNLNSIIFLQKYIFNYLNNKNTNKNFSYYLNKPIILNNYLSKINKSNILKDIQKIEIIQKKFREMNRKKSIDNDNDTIIKNSISSSNDNNSQKSKFYSEQKNTTTDEQSSTRSALKKNNIIKYNDLCELIQMIIQKITKNINQYIFYKIKNNGNDAKNINIFFSIIKRLIYIYNNLSNNKKNNNNNEIIKFINDNLSKNIYNLNKYNYLSFIPKKEENNLIITQLFLYKDKDLVNYICTCMKIEYGLIINNNINNLVQYRLIKEPLNDHNIFTIMRYMDMLYDKINTKKICLNCFCVRREKCGINCRCHQSSNLKNSREYKKMKLTSQPKIKTHSSSLSYSFDEINTNKNKDDDNQMISNVTLYDKIFKRNIYYSITKVDKLNNSMDDSESEIDVFQKMNKGTISMVNREKINQAYDECNKNKTKLNKINSFCFMGNQNGPKIRHISNLSSSSDNINVPNWEEEDNMLNKIKNYFEDKK